MGYVFYINNTKVRKLNKIKLIGVLNGKTILESILLSPKECYEIIDSFKESMKIEECKIYDNTCK